MKHALLSLVAFFCLPALIAQNPGDTLRVQAFTFESQTRDTVISFPTDPTLTYGKILLKYTMRCKDGLVSTSGARNLGCGEWDYSCNTYLVDSSKIEAEPRTIESHHITDFAGTSFPYKNTPVYDYLRGTQTEVTIQSTTSETISAIGTGTEPLDRSLITSQLAGKSQYLYSAAELSAGGITVGTIDGISLNVLADAGEARFLKIKMKHSSKSELDGLVDLDGFTEVYYAHTSLTANQSNRFQFHTPFMWDGSSNVLVEFTFTNIDAGTLANTEIEGEVTAQPMGLSATNEQEILITNSGYLQCNDFMGIGGNQNRTVEAWIKTTDGSNGEILGWGTNVSGAKWVFQFANGVLRLENAGGGTVATTRVDDGEWHHVACVLNGNDLGDISFYVDGVLDANSSVGTTAFNTDITNGAPVRISRGVNNRYLDATVDEVRIWDTNLSAATISEWSRLKVDSTHPNFANLQLYYTFDETGGQIADSSGNMRDATLIGGEYRVSQQDGAALFKDFVLAKERPNLSFYQGTYVTSETQTVVDRPIQKELRHFVVSRSIIPGDPNVAEHDEIQNSTPVEYWEPLEKIFDEATDTLMTENILGPDGMIMIEDLPYFRRFPFYNELVSFVTPYGINVDLGMEGKSWIMDMSDYVHLFNGDKRLIMTLGGQWQEDMDLEFLFVVGTPPRDVVQFEQIWQGTNRIGSARISQILDDTKMAPYTLALDPSATAFKLRSSITGHGAEGEFHQNGGTVNHKILVDQVEEFDWIITQECSENPIFPQGGTWIYDRQGWCPGEQTLLKEHDLTPLVTAGDSMTIDYTTSSPNVSNGDYRYHVAHQLVGYGAPNFQVDASVERILAPNNSAKYIRTGTICANPEIVIRNTGADTLRELSIAYWLNDAIERQTYVWTGNLPSMQEEVVAIPAEAALWDDIMGDGNQFHVEVKSPNQTPDAYAFNNTASSHFDVPEVLPSNITIEFRTNNYSDDNRYELLDAAGNVVGSNELPQSNTSYRDTFALENGCYKLVVTDVAGDGLQWWANPNQGVGYVWIRNADGNTIKTFERDFGGRIEYSFTTDFPLPVEQLDFLTSLNLYPNPTRHICTLEANKMSGISFRVLDMLGQMVEAPVVDRNDRTLSFDVQGLSPGLYIIQIKKGTMSTTRKLLVE